MTPPKKSRHSRPAGSCSYRSASTSRGLDAHGTRHSRDTSGSVFTAEPRNARRKRGARQDWRSPRRRSFWRVPHGARRTRQDEMGKGHAWPFCQKWPCGTSNLRPSKATAWPFPENGVRRRLKRRRHRRVSPEFRRRIRDAEKPAEGVACLSPCCLCAFSVTSVPPR